jgi:Domain of unknown function (DUF1772)
MTKLPKTLRLISLLACALVFGLTVSHVLLSPGSRGLDGATWLTVQHSFYGGFAIVGGLTEVIGLLATITDAIYRRRQPTAAGAPAFASLCFLGTLLSYFFGNRPVNTKVQHWTPATLPADWSSYRDTWDMAHAASAVLSTLALLALLVATIWPPSTETK